MRVIYLLLCVLLSTFTTCQPMPIPNSGTVYMSIPGVKGLLQMEVGPTMWQSRLRPDGIETQMRAMERKDALMITAFLQRVNFAGGAEKCRTEWWSGTEKGLKDKKLKLQDLQQNMNGDAAVVQYSVPEFNGNKIAQKVVHAYYGARDLCAEIHLSKVEFKDDDQKLFQDVLSSVKFLPDADVPRRSAGPSREETTVLAQASRFYLEHKYEQAAGLYQSVLDEETQRPAMNETQFRVLVDNLGMSYGLTGKLDRAKQTFDYGVTQQPTYPLFYYNLACTYAEMGKQDQALGQLRLFYKNKANMIAGESLPDPLTDDSFKNMVKDKAFVTAVSEMRKQ